ncbi:unnamed protein product [Linum tenue]|uniref:PsbQ-like protein 3, chloroplastic n=1 Tax=Linum tenue TaxID=586396 RepID=A0AAV0QVK1_9ROSI|nr:unnamed protein product [Linum tenue]
MMMIRLTSPTFVPSAACQTQQQRLRHNSSSSRIKPANQQQQLKDGKRKVGRRTAVLLLCATVTSLVTQKKQEASGSGMDWEQMLKSSGPSAPTLEEAVTGIRGHARSLLEVKGLLLEQDSWSEAQRLLRKSSSNLKIDLSSIIQSKPPALRPRLRALYSALFTTVSRLDYAARERDVALVWQLYERMAVALEEVLSAI